MRKKFFRKDRKAQFFIITVLIVAGSLSLTMSILEDYDNINFDQISSSRAPVQFSSLERSLEDVWYNEIWEYRREITIINLDMLRSNNFPVKLEVDLVGVEEIQDDCSDLRFTNNENGDEIPFQIEGPKDCSEDSIDVWLLVDLDGYTREEIYMFYGNENVDFPEFNTDIEVSDEGRTIENTYYSLKWDETSEGCGFMNINDRRGGNFFFGEAIHRTDETDCEDVSYEEGDVFIEGEYGGTTFRFFAENPLIRRKEDIEFDDTVFNGLDMMWYANYTDTENIFLDAFHPGDDDDISVMTDTDENHYDSFDIDDGNEAMGLGIIDSDIHKGIYLTTSIEKEEVDEIHALKAFDESGDDENQGFFRIGSATSDHDIGHLDYVFGSEGFPYNYVSALNKPFEQTDFSFGEPEKGMFYPSSGWKKMIDVNVENYGDSFFFDEYVNVSMDLSVFDDERVDNLIVVDDGEVRNRKVWKVGGEYDTLSYKEPDDFEVRMPFDEGRGRFVNASEDSSNYILELGTADEPIWDTGKHDISMDLRDGRYLKEVEGSSNMWPYIDTAFTYTMWIKDDYDYGENEEVNLFEGSEGNIQLRLNTSGGSTRVEGVFNNVTHEFTVQSDVTLDENEWHHLTYSYDLEGNRIRVFVDAEPSDWVDVEGYLPAPATTPEELEDGFEFGNGFDGMMDEFKYYDRTLSEIEILHQQNLYSTISFETSVEPRSTNTDVRIFADGNTGFEDYIVDSSEISYGYSDLETFHSDVRDFENSIKRFQNVLDGTEIARNLDMDMLDKCLDVEYGSGVFDLQKLIC